MGVFMKQIGTILVLALFLGACQKVQLVQPLQPVPTQVATTTYSWEVKEKITVLDGLKQESQRQGFEVKTKEYSFGTMVEAIGQRVNTADLVWIYYVNGKAGEVGAVAKKVNPGDIVLWKYEKPIY